MSDLITVEKLIEDAKIKGVNFGKGDPYNRLRYYTKIGWLPNMKRKMDDIGNVKGHYPSWVLDRLVLIEQLKEKGAENDEITKKVGANNRFQTITNAFMDKESRTQILLYTVLALLTIVLSNELGLIQIGKSKEIVSAGIQNQIPNQVIDSGTAFMPKNQKAVFIKTPLIKNNSKVYVTFTQDFSPAVRFWATDIREYEGFIVETDAPLFNNTEFNWWITN